MKSDQLYTEFDRQIQTLLDKDYPALCGLTKDEFLDKLSPLREKLEGLSLPEIDLEKGTLPFVIVVKDSLISPEKSMSKVSREGKNGVVKLDPLSPSDFSPIEEVEIPKSEAYLIINIDRGKESLNIRPEDALIEILKENRSPLTIAEGIGIVVQFPQFLIKNNCFSLLASRTGKDQRVPAIWINAKKEPNLGWCWDGNPHTWLGSASCSERIA
jgi:hypothetical protein